jgi:fibronectin-binding autotransporter adhesin
MADRYWVGGTAAWDGTAGTKWATTDGGTGGASVPTSADAVFFTALSGANTVTISTGNTGALSINCTGFTGTLAGSAAITVSGSITLVAGMGFTYTGITTINGSGTITSAGKTFPRLVISGSGIVVDQGDALDTSGQQLNLVQGTYNTNNFNLTCLYLQSSGASTRTLNLGSSNVTTTFSFLSLFDGSNFTFNAGTSTITNTATTTSGISNTGSYTFYNVSFTGTGAGTTTIAGNNTFNNLTVTAPSSAGVRQVTFDSRQTISGTLSTTGTAGNRRVWFRSNTYGIAQTLTVNATPSLTDADFRDLYVIGTAAPISGTRVGDLRGCRGITFSAAKTVYWVTLAGGNWSGNNWAASSGGAVSTNNFPLAQDTAVIENTGLNTSATVTMDSAVPYTGTVTMSTRTNAMTLAFGANQTIYGNWTNGSGTTLSTFSQLTFSGRNTQTITSAGKTFDQAIFIDSYGGTVELADSLNMGPQSLTVTNGTFDTKSVTSVTCGQLSSSSNNVRAISLGSSTINLSSASTPILLSAINLTFNAGTSQINCSLLSTVSCSDITFYNVSFTNTTAKTITITGANTFNSLTVTAPSTAGITVLSLSANQTITGTLTVAGASPVRRIFVRSDTLGTTRTLTAGTLSATDCDFRDITIAGTAAGSSPTRAGNCGGNSGITFPAAKTVYWNLAGTQNWSATAWASSSGGTPDINQFPLAQDTAVFDNTGSIGTVTVDQSWNIGTFDASGRSTAWTFSVGTTTPFIYGDWKFGTGISQTLTTGTLTFSKRGTQTITSAGKDFNCNLVIDCVTGTVQLADAMSTNSERSFTLTFGTFDAVSYNVTVGRVNISGTTQRTLKMGSGTWSLRGTGSGVVHWDATTTTNLTFYKGTANIIQGNNNNNARTFAGGGLSYNKFTFAGSQTNITTFTGNNQFTEFASTKTIAFTIALGSTTQTFGKWTITGTLGNVVTLTGTGTSHILAGACTSGIDYLAMGSIGFAATSPGEFYAGANSTATSAVAPVYLTAKPADSTRYWVGGTGNWSDTARWSTSSGGGSGASVPRSHDDVVFDSASNATAYTATVNAVTGGIRMKSLTIAGPASGNVTLAGSTAIDGIHGNVTLPATGLTRTYTGAITLSGSTTGKTLTTNGVALASTITVDGVECEWSLGSALNTSNSAINVNNGGFSTNNFNYTGAGLQITSGIATNSRSISLGSSTLTCNSGISFSAGIGSELSYSSNFVFNSGTSQINISGTSLLGNDQTFYNVAFTSTSAGTATISGVNSFNNLSFTGITSAGLKNISVTANQTITGTLACSAGTNATMRHFVRSNILGTTRTLTCAAVSLTDVDFRDITIAGAAAPATGTRIGDCKGNSGITFTAAANKYWNLAAGGNWGGAIGWATSSGGTPAINNFPLAQDTCFFEATGLNSGATVTINQAYNIGTIDMSARTTNTMTLATGGILPFIYGNWINGTGTTLTGNGVMTFAGRGSQTITSAGRTFTQGFTIDTPGGSVTLQDAFATSGINGGSQSLSFISGIFDAVSYNVTLSASTAPVGFVASSFSKTVALGSGTWSISSNSTAWSVSSSTNLTITGTGTISLTSASAKTFGGGSVSYTNITLNQGGAGTLTITGNNTFANITNTYKATGATTINFGTTTQRVGNFTAAGEAGRVLTLTGSSASSPCTLVHTGTGTAANVDYLVITGVRAY